MSIDKAKLRALAEAVKAFEDRPEHEDEHAEAKDALGLHMHCHTILALLDEIERLESRSATEQDRLMATIGQYAPIQSERDQLKAENEALCKDAVRLNDSASFVRRLCDAAGEQPSVATGYLHDILSVIAGESGQCTSTT